VVTSQFDIKCIDDVPNVCVTRAVERVQKLLRYVHKSASKDLSGVTIRGVVKRLLHGWKQTEHSLVPSPESLLKTTSHDVAHSMKVSLNSLSSSLQRLHQVWGTTRQEGNVKDSAGMDSACMDLEQLEKLIEKGNMETKEYLQHIISIQAEQRKKQIPCVLLLIPDQQSGANIIDKVQSWMKRQVMDQLLLIMQCEMRVAKGRLPACTHGVLWHRPEPTSPSDPPYGYKFSQPKESIQKLSSVLRHVTAVVKVCIFALEAPRFPCPLRLTACSRCWASQRACLV
jgi:hypothetical protein